MDLNALLNLAKSVLSPQVWQEGLAAFGALALLNTAVPKLLTWGVPAMARAADWLSRTALNSPLRPLILWQAPKIVLFLDALVAALTQLLDTFRDQLEKDLAAAQTPVPAPAPTPTLAPAADLAPTDPPKAN